MADDIKQIKDSLRLSEVIGAHVKLTHDGQEFKGLCPFHTEKSPSFTVVDSKQMYHCFGCGAHGDVIDWCENGLRMDKREAISYARSLAGIGEYDGSKPTLAPAQALPLKDSDMDSDEWKPILPVPADAPDVFKGTSTIKLWNPKRGKEVVYYPKLTFPYRNAAGELLGYVVRIEIDGKKLTPQLTFAEGPDGQRRWCVLHLPVPRPLYGLDRLAERPKAPVVIVEGEKAADAGQRLLPNAVVITWPGGTKGMGKVDWAPLKGRNVVMWPDADFPGEQSAWGYYQKESLRPGIQQIIGTGCRLVIIDPPQGSPEGWDAADAEADGWDTARAAKWLGSAVADAQTRGVKAPAPDPNYVRPKEPDVPPPPPAPDEYYSYNDPPPGYDGEPNYDVALRAPYTPLGHYRGVFYYLPNRSKQVIEMQAMQHRELNMMQLAPLDYWEATFPSRGGQTKVDWKLAADACMRACYTRGFFDPKTKLRGRGAWIDKGRSVLHLGETIIVDGVKMAPHTIPSVYTYQADHSVEVGESPALSSTQANKLVKICKSLSWENPRSALLLAGWCIVAPVCGILPWRPHIWLTGSGGSGKAQPHTARVLTPSGWRYMGDLEVGDYVVTPDNSYAKILGVYPQGVQQTFRITMSDGRSTRATGDHLWKVRINGEWRIRTTDQIIELKNKNNKASREIAFPVCRPVDIERNNKQELPLHPYVLGVMIGDASLGSEDDKKCSSIMLSSNDQEIVDRVRAHLPDFMGLFDRRSDAQAFRFGDLSRYGRRTRELVKELRLLGKHSHDKFIPEDYLVASVEDRWELLKGLMDTDGFAGVKGGMSYCTVSKQLAEDVCYLVRSLGGIASTTEKLTSYTYGGVKKAGRLAYNINIRFADRRNVFSLPRKVERVNKPQQYDQSFFVGLSDISIDRDEECSCIMIDHPDRLYVTDDFIVTHNTTVLDYIIKPVVGPIALNVASSTSESGIRQELGSDARPVIFDEAEAEDKLQSARIQAVLDLCRAASAESGAKIIKGTAGHDSKSFQIRSCFAFSSINTAVKHYADETRVTLLVLRGQKSDDMSEADIAESERKFADLKNQIITTLTPDYCAGMLMRTLEMLPTLRANIDTFVAAASVVLGSRRAADQIAPMLAGAYLLHSNKRITHDEALAWLRDNDLKEVTAVVQSQDDEQRLLQKLMSHRLRVQTLVSMAERTVGELIETSYRKNTDICSVSPETAEGELNRFGIRVDHGGGFFVSNTSPEIKAALADTPWASNWARPLRMLKGASAEANPVRFAPGNRSRSVWMPIAYVVNERD